MISDPVLHFAGRDGLSVLVGTVDKGGVPACCRGVAAVATDGGTAVTVYVPLATSRDVVANAAATKRLAIVLSHPIEHSSIQVKGAVRALRLARDDEAAIVEARLAGWGDVLARIGLPRRITRSLNHWPAFAIEIAVENVFEQTPGPNAGAAIR